MRIKEILKSLPSDKIKIRWNKNPIEVDLFCYFLPNIEFTISRGHLGSSNGWTERFNEKHKLIVCGGIVNGKNYLDSIQYGVKLQNPYNNFVNPFALFDIMNEDGKKFFINYYMEDIKSILSKANDAIDFAKRKIKDEEETIEEIKSFIS